MGSFGVEWGGERARPPLSVASTAHQRPREPEPGTSGSLFPSEGWCLGRTSGAAPPGKPSRTSPRMREAPQRTFPVPPAPPFGCKIPPEVTMGSPLFRWPTPSVGDLLSDTLPFNLGHLASGWRGSLLLALLPNPKPTGCPPHPLSARCTSSNSEPHPLLLPPPPSSV